MAMAEDKSDACGDRARLAACFAVTDDESPDLAVINACYAMTEERGSTSTNAPVEPLVAAGSGAAEPKRSWKGILQARDDPMWDSHIRPAILKEINKIFNAYKTIQAGRSMMIASGITRSGPCFSVVRCRSQPSTTSKEGSPR